MLLGNAMSQLSPQNLLELAKSIKEWGKALGFQQVGICDVDLSLHEKHLETWLAKGFHGEMKYMQEHGKKRSRPAELLPGTVRIISVRMDYLPPDASFAKELKNKQIGYISRYALGRDYHKVMRARLKKLAVKIQEACSEFNYRPFVDSAPVLEHAIAEKAGIGWTGKHSLTINSEGGSWFFLGELFIDIPLPVDQAVEENCGQCTACLTICPTQAIVAPYTVDARKCISYLTIEHDGIIPVELRPLMGNRIYGCDDCQLICPWNRYAKITDENDFHPRQQLKAQKLLDLFNWDESQFLQNTEGSPIRRIGFQKWQRNIAIALGNADFDIDIIEALNSRLESSSDIVSEHIHWAIQQQSAKQTKLPADTQVIRLKERLIRSIEKGLKRDA